MNYKKKNIKNKIEEENNNTLRHFGRRLIKHANISNLLEYL